MKSNKNILIHELAKRRNHQVTIFNSSKPIYDPKTQTSLYRLDGQSTACSKGTDGTEPKNEADQVMDDN
jgi:hypothetical protein